MLAAKAYAKINLGLEILYKRRDGYHAINSVFHRISLHDVLDFEPHEHISVCCDALPNEAPEQNLVYKAARVLQEEFDVAEGAKITIGKHIPIGAGLGGGSSDAAYTLEVLNHFWHLNASRSDLVRIGAGLGADVPFFLHQGACLATGTGTDLQELALELPWTILLVSPPLHISTAEAYHSLVLGAEERQPTALGEVLQHALLKPESLREHLRNDFEIGVFARHPELAALKLQLLDSGAFYAQMSGSGSSMFGLFENSSLAHRALAQFRGTRAQVCTFQP